MIEDTADSPGVRKTDPKQLGSRQFANLLLWLRTDAVFRARVLEYRTRALYRARTERLLDPLDSLFNELLGSEEGLEGNLTYSGVLTLLAEACRVETETDPSTKLGQDPLETLPPPEGDEHWAAKGLVLLNEGLWCDASACFNKALTLGCGNSSACEGKGACSFRFARAVHDAQLPTMPASGMALWSALLHVHVLLKQAQKCYETALALRPDSDSALMGLAACVEMGQLDSAASLPLEYADLSHDPIGPHAYLARLRREKEDATPRYRTRSEIEAIYKNNPRLLELARGGSPPLRDDELLQGVVRDLLGGMPWEIQDFVRAQVAVGELLTKEPNACLADSRDGYRGFVLTVNKGWRTLLHSIGKVLLMTAETKPGTYAGTAPFRADGSDDEAVVHVVTLLRQIQSNKMPHIPPSSLVLPDDKMWFLGLLHERAVGYTLAHELAHLLCDHLVQTHSPEQEFEADLVGFAMLLNWLAKDLRSGELRDVDLEAAITGAELVFVCLQLREDVGTGTRRTHPPMADRFNALREAFALSDAVYELPNMMMKKALELGNQAVRLVTTG